MIVHDDGTFEVERDDDSFPCPICKGYSYKVECTIEERKEFGCGSVWDCCSVAFVCMICNHRFAMSLSAPDWNIGSDD